MRTSVAPSRIGAKHAFKASCLPSRPRKAPALKCAASSSAYGQRSDAAASRRSMLIATLATTTTLGLSLASLSPAKASPFQELARGFIRPDVTPVDAVVILMDSKSTLKEISEIAATPADSELRFVSRKLWPAFAKTLREAGPAAPIVAALISGGDKEATLSEEYGGVAGAQPGLTDRVYIGLGRVLTISGRTIKNEAQAAPEVADEARAAIEEFLSKVPADVLKAAQDFRVARAAK